MTVAQRWQRFNALLRLAAKLGLKPAPDDQEQELVYERRQKLRMLAQQKRER